MKKRVSTLLLTTLFCFGSLIFLDSCKSKNKWSEDHKATWLKSCNSKFTKNGVEPEGLKRFCSCVLEQIQYDYTYDELKDEVIPAKRQKEFYSNCDFSY